jgi:alkyl sulfatase BDS1-like metallo-beta-lactamase superfamily hydrolase
LALSQQTALAQEIDRMKKRMLIAAFSIGTAFSVMAQESSENFSRPQQVYRTEVERATLENGGVISKAVLEQMASTSGGHQTKQVVRVADGVYSILGVSAANMTFIEGEQGIIVYDTGDDLAEAKEFVSLIRTVTDKPVSALIYSHAHYVWGAQAVIDESIDKDIPVIGNERLNGNILESGGLGSAIPELAPSLLARTFEQFHLLLPKEGPDGAMQAPASTGEKGFVPVNTPVSNGQTMTIDGVKMQFFTDYDSDTDDQTIVWLPDKRTVINNHVWMSFPNFYTLRGSEYRDPTEWAEGIRLIRQLAPEYMATTHTVPILGGDKVNQVLNGYFDAIMYLYDQTIRGILHGKTPEELRHWVQLPNELAEQPFNQMTYGEFSYYPPYIYNYAIGWFGRDVENLNRVPPLERAEKIVSGFGGVNAVKDEIRRVSTEKDYAWAGELGGYLVRVVPDDNEAKQLLADALRQMGYQTGAIIPRSWYLTRALALEGQIQIPEIVYLDSQQVLDSEPDTFVNFMRVRLDPIVSLGQDVQLSIKFTDRDGPTMALHVRSGIAEFIADVSQYVRQSDVNVEMSMDAWARYYVGETNLDQLLARDDVNASNRDKLRAFFMLFDQMHESKTFLVAPSSVN